MQRSLLIADSVYPCCNSSTRCRDWPLFLLGILVNTTLIDKIISGLIPIPGCHSKPEGGADYRLYNQKMDRVTLLHGTEDILRGKRVIYTVVPGMIYHYKK